MIINVLYLLLRSHRNGEGLDFLGHLWKVTGRLRYIRLCQIKCALLHKNYLSNIQLIMIIMYYENSLRSIFLDVEVEPYHAKIFGKQQSVSLELI
jgi:hypothetical protein